MPILSGFRAIWLLVLWVIALRTQVRTKEEKFQSLNTERSRGVDPEFRQAQLSRSRRVNPLMSQCFSSKKAHCLLQESLARSAIYQGAFYHQLGQPDVASGFSGSRGIG